MGHFKEPGICFLPRLLGFAPRLGNVGFEVEIVALGYVFSEYFGFPCQFPFHLTPFISSVIRDWYNGPRQPVLLGVSVPPYSKNETNVFKPATVATYWPSEFNIFVLSRSRS
jgi:hypothetical protein